MRSLLPLCLSLLTLPIAAQTGPTNPKAQKSYTEALQLLKQHREPWALDAFKAGQPLVVISISLDRDKDESKWRDFVAKNEMNWIQSRADGFDRDLATKFGVRAIPATFTIDADGVLQDAHVGDSSIEGKLKKLTARADALQAQGGSRDRPGGR